MEILDLSYHQVFYTTNSLGHLPAASQSYQPLALQTVAVTATDIYCTLSEYATRVKITVMFSQDEYQGTFWPSPVIHFTLEPTVLIK